MRTAFGFLVGSVLPTLAIMGFSPGGRAQAAFTLNPDNGHYYGLTSAAENFDQAELEAVTMGGHLASITSQTEQDFIANTFLTAPQSSAVPYWIGLTDAALEGTFKWTSGEALGFTNWNAGEPNNSGNEDYVAINWHYALGAGAKGTWNDTPLAGASFGGGTNGPYFGIIELNSAPGPVAAPEPATLSLAAFGVAGLLGYRGLRRRKATPAS